MALDKVIHEQSRLQILAYLAGKNNEETSFNEIREKLSFTSGNLSIQLKKLSDAFYIKIRKTFKDKKPYTTIVITPKGYAALEAYIDEMEKIINSLKNNTTAV